MIASKLSLSSTTHPYLVEGCNTITTADISLFTTLSRFDEIYRIHYKTNSRIVARTPSLLRFMRRVFNIRGVSKTCNMNEMKVYVRKFSGEKVFSSTDFGCKRYGCLMQLVIGCISLFYMWIYLLSELTSISNVYVLVVGDSAHDNFNVWVCITAVLRTLFYTSTCGLSASIPTNKFQVLMMGLLIVVLTIAVSASPKNKVTKKNYDAASNWTIDGFQALVTLFIAIACAEMFNQGSCQRVFLG
mmetsp:Transcript_46443/g.54271  ORF Transcript_46443/g.54271 Transcript_46443/m.54271 type:complete len:244 (+) Transcript_46443:229-960(+)